MESWRRRNLFSMRTMHDEEKVQLRECNAMPCRMYAMGRKYARYYLERDGRVGRHPSNPIHVCLPALKNILIFHPNYDTMHASIQMWVLVQYVAEFCMYSFSSEVALVCSVQFFNVNIPSTAVQYGWLTHSLIITMQIQTCPYQSEPSLLNGSKHIQ